MPSARHLVHGQNIGMVQRGCGVGFLLETAQAVGVGGQRLGQDLDGDFAVEPGVVGAVDFAHSTRTKGCANFILPEDRSGSRVAMKGSEDYTLSHCISTLIRDIADELSATLQKLNMQLVPLPALGS